MTVFGSERSRPTHWLKTGLAQARRVGRVEARVKHNRFVGSGFLVEGSLFGEAFTDLPLFLTCRHVVAALISADPAPASAPDITVLFEGMFEERSSRVMVKCHHVLIDSPVEQLNYALLLLDCWPGTVNELILAPRRLEPGEKVFVISYPLGGGLAVSLADNEVIARHLVGESRRKAEGNHVLLAEAARPAQVADSSAEPGKEFWALSRNL